MQPQVQSQVQPQVQSQVQPREKVVEEGEIPEAGNFSGSMNTHYGTLAELLADVEVCYPCPIHNVGMNELKSKKEWCQEFYLSCPVYNCPVFMNLKEFNVYHDQCRKQGHDWFTLDRIAMMKCECGETPTLAMSKSEQISTSCIFDVIESIANYSNGGDFYLTKRTRLFSRVKNSD